MNRLRVGILGATGMVGQRFVSLLARHPWFEVVAVLASERSAGKRLGELMVRDGIHDVDEVCREVDVVFSAINFDREETRALEMVYAKRGVAVVSNNSAHRSNPLVPIIMPEINPTHSALIDHQRQVLGLGRGLIAVKPNCSVQSFLPMVKALESFGVRRVLVTTLQAVSGAGKMLESWPEMQDNVIPFIGGEEEKTEQEPLIILGTLKHGAIVPMSNLEISATCIRVSVSNGHMASLFVELDKKVKQADVEAALTNYSNPLAAMDLPSAPRQFIHVLSEADRPQTRLDRDLEHGMAISVGRIRPDESGWKMIGLSHNTIRGAAGGAILLAELLVYQGYITARQHHG